MAVDAFVEQLGSVPPLKLVDQPKPVSPSVKPQAHEVENVAISFTRAQLDAVLHNPRHTPADVLNLLNPDFGTLLDSGVGVMENYTLRQHTTMVMGQFKKYFGSTDLPVGIDRDYFEFVLALHDIGKPKAIASGRRDEHKETVEIMRPVMRQLNYTEEQIALATSLVDGDPIGYCIRYGNEVKSAKEIVSMARRSGIPTRDFFKLLTIFYQVDAGSYTKDAGGQEVLDRLFSFNYGSIAFEQKTAVKIDRLREMMQTLVGLRLLDENSTRTIRAKTKPPQPKGNNHVVQRKPLGINSDTLDKIHVISGKETGEKKNNALEAFKAEHGTVRELAAKNDIYFAHAIQPFFGHNDYNNYVIGSDYDTPTVTWEDKLAVLLCQHPTVSASTVRRGSETHNLWKNFGVLFNSGIVEDAGLMDLGTIALGLHERRSSAVMSPVNIHDYMQRLTAVTAPSADRNEVILGGKPQAVGMFIDLLPADFGYDKVDSEGITYEKPVHITREGQQIEVNKILFSDIFTYAKSVGLPVFTFQSNGQLHASSLDKDGHIVFGEEISPQQLLEMKYVIPNSKKAELREKAQRITGIPMFD